jgi:hypothetical protein
MSTVDRISGLEQRLSGATIVLQNYPELSHPRNHSTVVPLQKSRIVFRDYLGAAGIPNINNSSMEARLVWLCLLYISSQSRAGLSPQMEDNIVL